jgi:hypothetical protein
MNDYSILFLIFLGDSFSFFVLATKTYYLSGPNFRLSFNDAKAVCNTCFGKSLADISNAGAIVGSPMNGNVCLSTNWF